MILSYFLFIWDLEFFEKCSKVFEKSKNWRYYNSHYSFREDEIQERERSRSVSVSPERIIEPEKEAVVKPDELEKNQQDETPIETKTEEEIEAERKRQQEEAIEQERLRQEVEKLESAIVDPLAIKKKKQLLNSDAESSGTDISDNEEIEETENKDSEAPTEIKSEEADLATHKAVIDPKEELKQRLIQQLAKKQEEQKLSQSAPEVANQSKAADVVDMFADTWETKEKDDGVKQEQEEGKPALGDVVEMEVDISETGGLDLEEKQAVVKTENEQDLETETTENQVEEKKDNFEETLKTLTNIRNKMEEMTKEELENALKQLPSLNDVTNDPKDGRTTPIHLRDIEIPLKSLTEYVHEKKALYKQCFHNINKKEFKSMLPKYLLVR